MIPFFAVIQEQLTHNGVKKEAKRTDSCRYPQIQNVMGSGVSFLEELETLGLTVKSRIFRNLAEPKFRI